MRTWRTVVAVYAAALLVFVVWLKADLAAELSVSPVLVVYGYVVVLYLGTRVALAAGYRPVSVEVEDAELPRVVVAVPAFNEAEHVEETLDALFALDYPADRLRVVVVDDGSTDATWERVQVASRRHPLLDGIRFSRNRGKRAAMAAAVRAADDAELVVFVDSDSVLAPDAVREIVKPFVVDAAGEVGAVTGHADVLNADQTLLTRLQQVRYFAAFRVIKAAESRFGRVTCASGCFSAYRREHLLQVLPVWENQTFLGQEATFGDDRALTNYLLRRGHLVRYQSTATSVTRVPHRWRAFLTQQLRWKKSWTRESLTLARFAWRWPLLASFGAYASMLFQLLGPLVALNSLVVRPLVGGADPWLYLVGLHTVAVLYGLLYAGCRRSPDWWAGVVYALIYSVVLSWQIYWAMLTARNTSWGTRDSQYDVGGEQPLAVRDTVGSPGYCGLPLRCPEPAPRVPASRGLALMTRPVATAASAPPSRPTWVVGVLALPVSAAPIVAWLLLH